VQQEILEQTPVLAGLLSTSEAERRRAWSLLYEGSFDRIYRLVHNMGVPPDDIEDVIQKVFQVTVRRINEIQHVERTQAWLRGIAVREVMHYRRWHAVRRVKRWLLRDTVTEAARPPATPEERALSDETRRRVHDVLGRMRPKLRDVLVVLFETDGSVQEAARILDIPPNTVRSRKRLAREQFTRLWGEGGDDAGAKNR
jgi:RNA polymerase sigma-70 factor (ECF subfamily)